MIGLFRWKFIFSISLSLAVTMTSLSQAQTHDTPRETLQPKSYATINNEDQSFNSTPWALFGGVGTGYGIASSQDYSESLHGAQLLLSGLLSYQRTHWLADLGGSWVYSPMSGTTNTQLPIQTKTRFGMIDISPRYRFGDHWQLGPIVNLAIGTDTSFGPSVGNTALTTLLGIKGVYEFIPSTFPIRLWSQISTDVSIANRNVWLGLLGIQIGLPLKSSHQVLAEQEKQPNAPTIAETNPKDVKVVLDPNRIFFSTNSSLLKPQVKQVLKSVGEYLESLHANKLSQNTEKWDEIEINGHADQRGRFQYNFNLSKKRANSVKEVFSEAGIPSDRLVVQAFSFLKPLDPRSSKEAWAKNRRVELIIKNVADPQPLIEMLKPLTQEVPTG